VTVLGITAKTAEIFGQISAELALAGTPIPTNSLNGRLNNARPRMH
jgi:predicted nucleic acid-binding protein